MDVEDGLPSLGSGEFSFTESNIGSSAASPAVKTAPVQAVLIDDSDNDEFAGLALKPARKVGAGGSQASGSRSSASKPSSGAPKGPLPLLRPPPQGSAAQPPPSKADTGINLISMEDLLTSEPVKQTPPTTVAESSAIDLDFFSTPQPVSTAPAPAPAAGVGSPDAAPKASAMTEADFDAFLNTITHSK